MPSDADTTTRNKLWAKGADGEYRFGPVVEPDDGREHTMLVWAGASVVEKTTKTFLAGSAGAGYKPTIFERIKNAFRR